MVPLVQISKVSRAQPLGTMTVSVDVFYTNKTKWPTLTFQESSKESKFLFLLASKKYNGSCQFPDTF